jgi:hypothetical protein
MMGNRNLMHSKHLSSDNAVVELSTVQVMLDHDGGALIPQLVIGVCTDRLASPDENHSNFRAFADRRKFIDNLRKFGLTLDDTEPTKTSESFFHYLSRRLEDFEFSEDENKRIPTLYVRDQFIFGPVGKTVTLSFRHDTGHGTGLPFLTIAMPQDIFTKYFL